MGFKNLGFSKPRDATSLVLRSVKKKSKKISKTCIFLESTCQVDQKKL